MVKGVQVMLGGDRVQGLLQRFTQENKKLQDFLVNKILTKQQNSNSKQQLKVS